MLLIKHKSRVCETRLLNQDTLNEHFTSTLQHKQLIHLAKWLHDECHSPKANSKIIIREFFKRTNEMMHQRWL